MSDCVLFRKGELDKILTAPPKQGKKMLFGVSQKFPLGILEDHEILDNEAEIHKKEGDLWLCLEGEATFIYGGELIESRAKKNADGTTDENELKAKEIRGGAEAVLYPGDWLWIPAGEPHQHRCSGTVRLAIIKIPFVLNAPR